jgi:capsular polysaccharide biosynthesis protein
MNVSSREELSKTTRDGLFEFPFSFYDVPERKTLETCIFTIQDCRIVSCYDQWGAEFCAIVNRDDRLLGVRGTTFTTGHAHTLRSPGDAQRIKKVCWVFEIWSQNYLHWLVYHLPKILVLKTCGLADQIILPKSNNSFGFIESSLEYLGLNPSRLPRMNASLLHVDELTVVGVDYFPTSLLHQVRAEIAGPTTRAPYRRIFISRENAERRRLENEDAVWTILQSAGFERIAMEGLSFREQITLMSETAVLFGTSGAGFANMLFCPPGAHIIEISDPDYPSPDFYALANSLGHHYWLLHGGRLCAGKPGYRNLLVDPSRVQDVIGKVNAASSALSRE